MGYCAWGGIARGWENWGKLGKTGGKVGEIALGTEGMPAEGNQIEMLR